MNNASGFPPRVNVIWYLDGNVANEQYGHANITSLHVSYNNQGPLFWYIPGSMVGFIGSGGPSRCAVTLRTMHSSSSFDGVFSLAFTGAGIQIKMWVLRIQPIHINHLNFPFLSVRAFLYFRLCRACRGALGHLQVSRVLTRVRVKPQEWGSF